MSLKM